MRADVQNLETDKDRDVIHLRHLKSERDKLQTELNQLCAERDAFEVIAKKWEKANIENRVRELSFERENARNAEAWNGRLENSRRNRKQRALALEKLEKQTRNVLELDL